MDSKAEEFVTQLLNGEPHTQLASSSGDVDLPPWFDEKKYNRGRKFFLKYFFGFASSYMVGLMVILVVPSILKVLAGTLSSFTPRAAYLRYWNTFQQLTIWLNHDLKPGSKSWVSLHTVRKLHLRAMKNGKIKGYGTITQRDLALTLGAAVSYGFLKPDEFGVYQCNSDDWEGYNHFWGVIAFFMGLDDRYNICIKPVEETTEICQKLVDRVFAPCLENPPENFYEMVQITLDGSSAFYAPSEPESVLFITKNLSGVPGYIFKESERISLRKKIMELTGNIDNKGIKSTDLIEECGVEGLPQREPRILYLSDYQSIDSSLVYKQLPLGAKFRIYFMNIVMAVYSTAIGRIFFNNFMYFELFLAKYIPVLAFWKFGFSVHSENVFDGICLKSANL